MCSGDFFKREELRPLFMTAGGDPYKMGQMRIPMQWGLLYNKR